MAIIIREAGKIWRGNIKVHFKKNNEDALKLEELISQLITRCTIERIGFGRGIIQNIYGARKYQIYFKC